MKKKISLKKYAKKLSLQRLQFDEAVSALSKANPMPKSKVKRDK